MISSKFIDFKNIDNPIQKFYRYDSNFILEGSGSSDNYNLRYNEYSLQDSKYDVGSPKSGTFLTCQELNRNYEIEGIGAVHTINVKLDVEFNQFDRTMTTIFEVIGTVGGTYEIIFLFMKFLVPIFTKRILEYSLVNRLNQRKADFKSFRLKLSNRVHNYEIENNKVAEPADPKIGNIQTNKSSRIKENVDKSGSNVIPRATDSYRNMF